MNGPPAFNSISTGAVNVDCPRVNIDGTEKAVEIINNMIVRLDAYQEESKRIATKYACWRTKIDVVQEVRTPHLSPSQPLDAHHHKLQPPHDSPSNTTDQNSVILHTMPQPHLHPSSISFPETSAYSSTNPLFQRPVSTATTTPLVISQPTTTPTTPKSHACSDHPPTSTPQFIPPTIAQPLLPEIIATNIKQVH